MTADELIAAAQAAARANDYATAGERHRAALKALAPGDPVAAVTQALCAAWCFIQCGRALDAIETVRMADELAPVTPGIEANTLEVLRVRKIQVAHLASQPVRIVPMDDLPDRPKTFSPETLAAFDAAEPAKPAITPEEIETEEQLLEAIRREEREIEETLRREEEEAAAKI